MENQPRLRNITNGEFRLNFEAQDLLPNDQRFSNGWQIQDSQADDIALAKTTTFLENIRTGQFSEISDSYLVKNVETKQTFTSDTFDSEMRDKKIVLTHVISKIVLFFQGILAGMCLLQLIVLQLTETVYSSQVFRVDQIIRITAFTSTFGSIFVLLSSYRLYNEASLKATVIQINQLRKQYIGSFFSCFFYLICWIILNVAHPYAVKYNINQTKDPWSQLQVAYMVFALIGWLSSVITSNYLSVTI